ncbi:MAG: extracellular solute-binding protein [Pseudomonadota bacterium]
MVRCREGKKNRSATLKHKGINRRDALALLAAAPVALTAQPRARADSLEQVHGLSVFGDLKYPPSFQHFDYVNPHAPVGGVFRFLPSQWILNQNPNTFNSMNTFILRGDAPVLMEMTFASLMARAYDEPDAVYGFAAEQVRYDTARKYFEFDLRNDVSFHDGSPLTADDVVFSIETIKKDGHPMIAGTLNYVESIKALSKKTVAVRLAADAPRDVIFAVAGVPLLSKNYYSKVVFKDVTIVPALGSGPFNVGRFDMGRYVEYERVDKWWGWQIPSQRAQLNWQKIRVDFFRDYDVAFEAFKAGQYYLREEAVAKTWATGYHFPAVQSGDVKKLVLPDGRLSGMQGFFINMRREKFMDPRVRRALALAFDFEWSNENLFYKQYQRTQSVFQNSPLMAEGKPNATELALLEPFRSQLPAEAFGEALIQPVSDGTGRDRKLLREAGKLLRDAGIDIRKEGSFLPNGERFTVEFLNISSGFERIILPYIKNLASLGVNATLRTVDPAQYQARTNEYDFDIASQRYGLDSTPGDGLKRVFSSKDADTPGSYNLSGIKHPVVDAMIEKIIAANSREDLNTACRALDRVLRSLHFWVPAWSKPTHSIACWDIFKAPEAKPPAYTTGILETWWIDPAQAKKLGKGI